MILVGRAPAYALAKFATTGTPMDAPDTEFVIAGSLDELKAKGRVVVHGGHRPILDVHDRGRVFALDNQCPQWVSRSTEAASRTGSSPVTGIPPVSISKAAAPST